MNQSIGGGFVFPVSIKQKLCKVGFNDGFQLMLEWEKGHRVLLRCNYPVDVYSNEVPILPAKAGTYRSFPDKPGQVTGMVESQIRYHIEH